MTASVSIYNFRLMELVGFPVSSKCYGLEVPCFYFLIQILFCLDSCPQPNASTWHFFDKKGPCFLDFAVVSASLNLYLAQSLFGLEDNSSPIFN